MRAQGRERQGADLGLGELPVILEQRVVEARREGQWPVRAPDDRDRNRVERVDRAEVERPPRPPSRTRSRGPPIASSTVRVEAPKPRSASSAASAAGVAPSQDRTRSRAPGWRCGTIRLSARPWRVTRPHSASGQPRRAQARLKAEGSGKARISAGGTRRAISAPMP